MRFWIVRQGSSTAKVRGANIQEARERATQIGFRSPWSIVLFEGKS